MAYQMAQLPMMLNEAVLDLLHTHNSVCIQCVLTTVCLVFIGKHTQLVI